MANYNSQELKRIIKENDCLVITNPLIKNRGLTVIEGSEELEKLVAESANDWHTVQPARGDLVTVLGAVKINVTKFNVVRLVGTDHLFLAPEASLADTYDGEIAFVDSSFTTAELVNAGHVYSLIFRDNNNPRVLDNHCSQYILANCLMPYDTDEFESAANEEPKVLIVERAVFTPDRVTERNQNALIVRTLNKLNIYFVVNEQGLKF